MTPTQRIALWADKLRDISATGLSFCKNIYDRENYTKVQNIAIEMLALATSETPEQMEPLRAPIFNRPAPIPVGDAAVIDDAGNILLVQRTDNQKWAMPGGTLAVGETPSEGVVREALEETGVRCEPITLVGIFDSRLCGTISRHHLYQFVFLCKLLDDSKTVETPLHAAEVLNVQWFAEHDLPDDLDPAHVTRITEAYRVWRGDARAYFDQQDPK